MAKFTYCTTLDMNMGYWTIPMCPESQRICTIILPWGKFSYKCLTMGLAPLPDVYQEKMSLLFIDLEEVKVYFDDILVLGFDSSKDHLIDRTRSFYSHKKSQPSSKCGKKQICGN